MLAGRTKMIPVVGLILLLSACGGGGSNSTPTLPTLSWASAEAIDAAGTGNSLHPQIGVDDNGNAEALWLHDDSTSPDTTHPFSWTNSYTAGSGWGTAQQLDNQTYLTYTTYPYPTPNPPSLAMNGAGQARAAWEQWINFTGNVTSPSYLEGVWASSYDTGSWASPVPEENTYATGVQSIQPQAAINANGTTAVIWNRKDSRYGPGGLWIAYDVLAPYTLNVTSAENPRLSLDDAGNVIAIWRGTSGVGAWTMQYDQSNNVWTTPAALPFMDSFNVQSARLAANAAGEALAVVVKIESNNQKNVYAEHFAPVTVLGTPGHIGDWAFDGSLQFSLDNATQAQVAVDASGNGMAVWVQTDYYTAEQKIWASYFNQSQMKWASPVQIDNQTTGNGAASPQVAFAPDGKAIAVWSEFDGSTTTNSRIWSNVYTPGSGWGAPSAVESGTGYTSSEPQLKIDSNGIAMCVWTRSESGQSRIWASHL